MTKRISCKVVRSVPLTKAINALMGAHRLHKEHHSSDDVVAVNVWVRYTSNSATYPGSLDISGVRYEQIDYRLRGQILDCYV